MLIKVSVSNFKSFEKETSLSMISASKTRENLEHKVQLMSSTHVLKYGVIYGANASGKSNLVEVFTFIKYCLTNVIPLEATNLFCKNNEKNKGKESLFELHFSIGKKIYSYGFSAILSKRTIEAEWLYELHQNGNNDTLFEWEKGEKPVLGNSVLPTGKEGQKVETYLDDFNENGNILFLSFMNKDKRYDDETKLSFFKKTYSWIVNDITVCTPNSSITNLDNYYDTASLQHITDIIKTFDTGISKINIENTTFEELSKELPKPIFNTIIEDLKSKVEQRNNSVKISMRIGNNFYNIEVKNGQEPVVTTLKLKHGSSFYDFNFEEESDGTRRLFELIDMLLNESKDKIYIVDEIERSLHPKLTSRFIELFNQIHKNDNVQLLFTTHESSIMDQNLFRRDEIWFVERDGNNCSSIYSLDRFKERYDKKLSKSYLEGRYGAIPIFSYFNFEEDQ